VSVGRRSQGAIKSAMMNGTYVKATPATALAFGILVFGG
jgi:hypothetical protein